MIDIDTEKIAHNPWFAAAVGALVVLSGAPGDTIRAVFQGGEWHCTLSLVS